MNPSNQTFSTDQLIQLAIRHHQAGELELAEGIYIQILHAQPDNIDALHLLGLIHLQQGRHDSAIALIQQAIAIAPNVAKFHGNLGNAFKSLGTFEKAVACYKQALSLDPGNQLAYGNYLDLILGNLVAADDAAGQLLTGTASFFHQLQIEITTDCNLKCEECPRTIGMARQHWVSRHMSIDDFRLIVEHAPRAAVATLQGVGEPTLHPLLGDFIPIVRASGKFQHVILNTNALARDLDYYRKLHETGLTTVSISVDSLNQEVAALCRFGTKVEKLKQRIVDLAAIFPGLSITLVASRLNVADIPATLVWLNKAGNYRVEIQVAIDFKRDHAQTNALSNSESHALLNRILGMKDEIQNLSLAFSPSMLSVAGQAVSRCNKPFLAPYVTIDGFLTPCCVCYDESLYGHANLIRSDMQSLWATPVVSGWLQSYLRKSPDMCTGCSFNPCT